MDKKWSMWIRVFGVIDILIGLLAGTPNLLYGLWQVRINFRNILTPEGKFNVAVGVAFIGIGSILLFLVAGGFLLVNHRALGRKLLLLLSPLIGVAGFISLSIAYFYSEKVSGLVTWLAPTAFLFVFLLIQSIFLLLPKVKAELREGSIGQEKRSALITLFAISLCLFPLRYTQRFAKICILAFIRKQSLASVLPSLYLPLPAFFFLLFFSIFVIVGVFLRRKWGYYSLIAFSFVQVVWSAQALIQNLLDKLSGEAVSFLRLGVPAVKLLYFLVTLSFFLYPKVRKQFK